MFPAFPMYVAFDHLQSADQLLSASGFDGGADLALYDNGGIRFASGNDLLTNLPTAQTDLVMGARYTHLWNTADLAVLFETWNSGATQLRVEYASGVLRVKRSGTTLGSYSVTFNYDTEYYIEFAFKIDGSAGSYELKIDGVTVLSDSGLNTGSGLDQISWHGQESYRFNGNSCFTYAYAKEWDGPSTPGFLGSLVMTPLTPNSDVGTPDWTPLSGSDNYAMVDELPSDGDTSYVSTTTDAHVDQYGIDVSGVNSSDNILAVVPFAIAAAPAGGTLGIELGGDDGTASYGTQATVATTDYRAHWSDPIETLPSGGAITPANVGTIDLLLRSSI